MAQLKLANGYANSRLDVLRDIRYAWIDCSVKRVGRRDKEGGGGDSLKKIYVYVYTHLSWYGKLSFAS